MSSNPLRRLALLLPLAACLTVSVGCQLPPLFGPQGNIDYQRRKATVFDPFADADMGPEVVGGRPREYQRGAPEVDRGRWFQPNW